MKRKINVKIVLFSVIALAFIALTFFVNPYFIIGALVLMLLNQAEINRMKKGK
jgi:hypothetical protein